MNMTSAVFLVVLLTLVGLFFIWGLWCNERSFKHRLEMLERIYHYNMAATNKGTWTTGHLALYREFNLVDYGDHFWSTVFFQDYRKLYPKRVQEVMKWA